MIFLVAASERETAQTVCVLKPGSVAHAVSWESIGAGTGLLGKLPIAWIVEASGRAHQRR